MQAGAPVLSKHTENLPGPDPSPVAARTGRGSAELPSSVPLESMKEEGLSKEMKNLVSHSHGILVLDEFAQSADMRGLAGKELLREYSLGNTYEKNQHRSLQGCRKEKLPLTSSLSSPLSLCEPPTRSRAGATGSL